ncbi:MAG: hypothetical protein FWF63_01625 [Fibromonadales bacterium]|nr:hypothetical protein [Fibromonadales bacterium]
MDYPEWLIGSWVCDDNDKEIWTFNANGAYAYSGNQSYRRNGTYVVIERVLAITAGDTSTYDMFVSKDNRVLILRRWNGSSLLLRKK